MIGRRLRRVISWYWLLALWIAAVLVTRHLLDAHGFNPRKDAWLIFSACSVVSISILIMLIQVRPWTIRALGILGLACFDAGLYGLSSSINLWHWHTATRHDANLLIALLLVSAPLLLLSQIKYGVDGCREWRKRRRDRRRSNAP
jgi:hypothetical protein